MNRAYLAIAALAAPMLVAACAQSPEEQVVSAVQQQADVWKEQAEEAAAVGAGAAITRATACRDQGECAGLTMTPELLATAGLPGADLTATHFTNDLDLSGVDFTGANLTDSQIGSQMSGPSVSGATFATADLSGARLMYLDLSGADFTGANLTGASLYGSDLSGADFTGATFASTDLGATTLTAATGIPSEALGESSGTVTLCVDGKPDPTGNDYWKPDYAGTLSAGEQMDALVPCEWPTVGIVDQERYDAAVHSS